jgi:hypothetical protein
MLDNLVLKDGEYRVPKEEYGEALPCPFCQAEPRMLVSNFSRSTPIRMLREGRVTVLLYCRGCVWQPEWNYYTEENNKVEIKKHMDTLIMEWNDRRSFKEKGAQGLNGKEMIS